MSWITEIEESDATGDIADVYARLREERGRVANILKEKISSDPNYRTAAIHRGRSC